MADMLFYVVMYKTCLLKNVISTGETILNVSFLKHDFINQPSTNQIRNTHKIIVKKVCRDIDRPLEIMNEWKSDVKIVNIHFDG